MGSRKVDTMTHNGMFRFPESVSGGGPIKSKPLDREKLVKALEDREKTARTIKYSSGYLSGKGRAYLEILEDLKAGVFDLE